MVFPVLLITDWLLNKRFYKLQLVFQTSSSYYLIYFNLLLPLEVGSIFKIKALGFVDLLNRNAFSSPFISSLILQTETDILNFFFVVSFFTNLWQLRIKMEAFFLKFCTMVCLFRQFWTISKVCQTFTWFTWIAISVGKLRPTKTKQVRCDI